MPFFKKKEKHVNKKGAKINKGVKRKIHQEKRQEKDDEISSDEDFDTLINGVNQTYSDDETIDETPQEKRLRLGKMLLEEIQREETERFRDDSDEDGGAIDERVSKRLKTDYLKQIGKLRITVADQYKQVNVSDISFLKCTDCITCICISSDDIVYSGDKRGNIIKWSLKSKIKIGNIPHQKPLSKKETVANPLMGHKKAILCLAVSSDNKFLAVGDISKEIQIWDAENLKHIGTLKGHKDSVTGVIFRIGTHTLYSCSADKTVKVWSLDEMSYVETVYGHQNPVTSIDALNRERAITSGGMDTSLRIWKITEESHLLYNGHKFSVDIVRFINEEHFVSGGADGQICVWSIMRKKPLCIIEEAHGVDPSNSEPLWIISLAAFINTDLFASGSSDGNIKLWKLSNNFKTVSPIQTIPMVGFINDLRFSNNGENLIVAVGREQKIGRWTTINIKNRISIIPLKK